jgi:hypothetical protein
MTVYARRLGKQGHHRSAIGDYCHDLVPSGMRLVGIVIDCSEQLVGPA